MSTSKKLRETFDDLDLDTSAEMVRESVISKGLGNLKGKLSDLDIQVESSLPETPELKPRPRYERGELADVAREVYRENVCPRMEKTEEERHKGEAKPSTIASRANMKALSRSLAGMRTSGNEGKVSPVGPNGTGNLGKASPTGDNGSGNVGTNGAYGNYYALTTDMTLEEYEAYVHGLFEGEDCGCKHKKEEDRKDAMPKGDVGHDIHKRAVAQYNKQNPSKKVKEDVVHELERRLVTMGSTDWIVVDQLLREYAAELEMAPRTISREFKSVHGLYPDKWIKEHLEVEVCGYMPLEEASRLNKVGTVYEVTFMFRGGTNRLKFFWPMPGQASKDDMQREVEKFWPKARLIAYYPTIDNEEQTNYMVMAPPVTENYHFLQPDVWNELPEVVAEGVEMIFEEEGEPISPIINEENGYSIYVEDHDTGEERQIFFTEGGLRDWFGKSKSKDGKKGWVNVVTGDSCASDKPGEGVPKCVSSSKRSSMSKEERKASAAKKRREDPGQQSKSGASKPTNVKTDVKEETTQDGPKPTRKQNRQAMQNIKSNIRQLENDEDDGKDVKAKLNLQRARAKAFGMSEEVIEEEKDKKGKGSGKKDACYNKVKSRYSVWPSAYASGALVKCRQKGADNWGNSSKKEEVEYVAEVSPSLMKAGQEFFDKNYRDDKGRVIPYKKPKAKKETKNEEALDELKCWKGYRRKPGSVPGTPGSCVKEDEECPICNEDPCQCLEGTLSEDDMKGMSVGSGDKRSVDQGAGLTKKGVEKYRRKNPGSKLQTAVTTPPSKLKPGSKAAGRRKSFCARSRGWDGERGKAARRRWNC